MIEIVRARAGRCEVCKERTAEYAIHADAQEWYGQPTRLCQPSFIPLSQNNQVIRAVLFIQAATNQAT